MLALMFVATLFAQTPPTMTGLWAARRDFGPYVRGVLEIETTGAVWRAQIAGRTADVRRKGDTVVFELPNGEGSFRGAKRGDEIDGHWIQPTGGVGWSFATPVTLVKQSPSRWRGIVTPIDMHMTFFLQVTPDGAFLRNPERNNGRFGHIERLDVDGKHAKLVGKDGKPVYEGTWDAENGVLSFFIDNANATYDFQRATPAEEAAFYPRGKNPVPWTYRKPLQRDDGWSVGSLEDAGIDRDGMAKMIDKLTTMPMDSVHTPDIHAVLIARHGKLVFEEYFHGTSRDEPHDTRSAAKSLTSVLAGAAKVPVSTRVYAAMGMPAGDPRKEALTLENLLMMASGLDCDDADDNSPGQEDKMQEQTAQPDWIRYTLDLKMIRDPGTKSVYCSCQPNLAGGVIQHQTGRWLPDLFRDLVARPLRIERYGVNLMPTGDAYMGGGVRFLPRDFMKLAQMMIDGGEWHGRRIVSAEWAKRSTSPLTTIGTGPYGYLWWVGDYPYKGRKVRAFFADGNGGQQAMGIPELDLVVAFWGGSYGDHGGVYARSVLLPDFILPAVK
jgi:CubicO group peptidase (beta-lactamase class C family)